MSRIITTYFKINIPDYYKQAKYLEGNPRKSYPYGFQTDVTWCYMLIYPLNKLYALPFDDNNAVISGIHESLKENQGIIKVDNGLTRNGKKYVYSIVKTKSEVDGVTYNLTVNIENEGNIVNITGYFGENGTKGIRENMMLDLYLRGKDVGPNLEGWAEDPYDPNFKKGILMNKSELEDYDEHFDGHCLTETRNFVHYLIENN